MRDSEVVSAIVAGDPDGLAEAYDRYASPLYTYCRSLLREPADAADAVQDTFVIAASRLAGLRDHNRLRSWLYAVARNECMRRMRLRTVEVTSALDVVPELSDESVDVSRGAEHEELRALLNSAVRGLNAGEHDLIELQLQQDLDATEIAAILGVSRNHAHALLSRARDQLETSLGAVLVARSGREACPALDTLLAGWDGQLTVLMRKRLNRHIEGCPACTDIKRRELAPTLLLGLAPLAALPVAPPSGLRAAVLKMAAADTPAAAAHRARVLQRAPSMRHGGFPQTAGRAKPVRWRRRWRHADAMTGAVAAAAAATAAGLVLTSGLVAHQGQGHAPGQEVAAGGSTSGAALSLRPRGSGPALPTAPDRGMARVSPVAAAGGVPSATAGRSPEVGGTSSVALAPSAGPDAAAGPTGAATYAGTAGPATPAGPATGSSTAAASNTATATATATAPSPPKPGVLKVSARRILLSTGKGGTLTLTASGGPVPWSIATPSSLIGTLTVSPTSGTLAAGQSVTVTVSVTSLIAVDSRLSVNPGGISVTIVVGLGV
jgi:RNA polymerase sigma factor (sigma-70 family)